MSFRLVVSGHKNFPSNEGARAFEEEVLRKFKEFVVSLEDANWVETSFGSLQAFAGTPEEFAK